MASPEGAPRRGFSPSGRYAPCGWKPACYTTNWDTSVAGAVEADFCARHGLSLERAWALLAFICQARYPVARIGERAALMDMTQLPSFGWSEDEINSARSLLVRSLDDLRLALPPDPLADPGQALDTFRDVPLIEVSPNVWWGHGPFLVERLLRTFYNALTDAASTTQRAGEIVNAFGRAAELYVEELVCLARAARLGSESLSLNKTRRSKRWLERRPEYEIGSGRVLQQIEVKTHYFSPTRLYGRKTAALFKSLEANLLSKEKGVGQLACHAIGRYAGVWDRTPNRIQSILVVLEPLPVSIPGSQVEARQRFHTYVKQYMAEATARGFELPTLGPAHLQCMFLSMEELEYLISLTTTGTELTDLCDKLYGSLTGVLLPARVIMDKIGPATKPTHVWLGTAFDELFEIYERNFPEKVG